MSNASLREIPEKKIQDKAAQAKSLLENVTYTARNLKDLASAPQELSAGISRSASRFRPTTPGLIHTAPTARPSAVRLMDKIMTATGSDLPSPVPATVVQSVHRALSVALAISDTFAEMTPLGMRMKDNASGALSNNTEFKDLLSAQGLVALSVFGNVLVAKLSASEGSEKVELDTPAEFAPDLGGQGALKGALAELSVRISEHAKDDAHLVATALSFGRVLAATAQNRATSTPAVTPFEQADFRIEADELTLSGFSAIGRKAGTSLTMSFKKPEEVIGNAIAKHQSLRLAKMLMAYDMERRKNPFAELGGFIFTFMGDGEPGTGKTTVIQMMAGMVNDYCEVAGYPFVYRNLSVENVDSYQGKSGQNARAFIDAVLDPSSIGFGTIDDIDQVAGKRGDRQSSAGQQEITAVLMEAFAGANTVVRGNCTFGMFSNYPENVDDALRQRAGARFLVDGPISREDYIDILAVLLGKNHSIPVGDHELYAQQEIRRAVKNGFAQHNLPQEVGLKAVWDDVQNRVGRLDTLERIGTYLKAIKEADKRFTGRAIKNITDAVKVRAMDFELPDDWFENAGAFMHRPYEEKMAMISELRTPITPEMVIQEINRYADSEFRYADKSDEAAINGMVRDMKRRVEAEQRFRKGM